MFNIFLFAYLWSVGFCVTLMNSTMPGSVQSFTNSSASTVPRSKLIRMLTSVSYSGVLNLGPITTLSQQLALEKLKTLPNWLPGYDIEFEMIDDGTNDELAVPNAIRKLVETSVNRFPLMGYYEIATQAQFIVTPMLKIFGLIGLASGPLPEVYEQRNGRFSAFLPWGETQSYYTEAVVDLLLKFGWKKAAIVTDSHSFNNMLSTNSAKNMEKVNVTLLHLAKINTDFDSAYHWESAFEDLSRRKPRIILVFTLFPVDVACYMHRYKLFGPNYVILSNSWNYIDENSAIPDYLSQWCNKNMLFDIVTSTIYYGDATLADIYGENTTDWMGTKKGDLVEQIGSLVDDPSVALGWDYWVPIYYDRCILLGLMLNETETMLNAVNMTLSDWTMDSVRFQRNSSFITNLLVEAFSQISVVGIKGEYGYSRLNRWSTSSLPIVFTQTHISEHGNSTYQEPIGYYKSNEKLKTVIYWDKIKWRTRDYSVPKDDAVLVKAELPLFSVHVNFIFLTFAIGIQIWIVVLLVIKAKIKRLAKNDIGILAANSIIVSHIYVLPFGTNIPSGIWNCSSICLLLTIGFCLFIKSVFEKLQFAMEEIRRDRMVNKWALKFYRFSTVLLPPVLLLCSLTVNPIAVQQVIDRKEDAEMIVEYGTFQCQVIEALFGNSVSLSLNGIATALVATSLIRTTASAFQIMGVVKQHRRSTRSISMAKWSNVVYVTLLLLLAAGLIGILMGSDAAALTMLSGSISLGLVVSNLATMSSETNLGNQRTMATVGMSTKTGNTIGAGSRTQPRSTVKTRTTRHV